MPSSPIQFTITPSRYKPLELEQHEGSWYDLTALFSKHNVGKKDGWAIVPAILNPCPAICPKHGQKGDCGGGKPHRLAANVSAVTMFGIDLDDWELPRLEEYVGQLNDRGFCFWVYSTHSFDPPQKAKVRVFIALSRPIPIDSPERWSNELWPALMRHVGLSDLEKSADQSCRDAARLYYLPRKLSPTSPTLVRVYPGAPGADGIGWGTL